MKQEHINGNKLIAEFLGAKTRDGVDYDLYGFLEFIEDGEFEQHFFPIEDMNFHSSWDWLMPVVDKIESLFNGGIEVGIHFGSTIISQCRSRIGGDLHQPQIIVMVNLSEGYEFPTKIDFAYQAVVEFITWYNAQKP